MKTKIVAEFAGLGAILEWEDGVVSGTDLAVAALHDVEGTDQYANPQWPTARDVDLTQHLDFVVAALAVLDNSGKALIEGDLPYVEPMGPDEIA